MCYLSSGSGLLSPNIFHGFILKQTIQTVTAIWQLTYEFKSLLTYKVQLGQYPGELFSMVFQRQVDKQTAFSFHEKFGVI